MVLLDLDVLYITSLPLGCFGACGVRAHRWDGARCNSDAVACMCGVGSGSSPAGRRPGATPRPLSNARLQPPSVSPVSLPLCFGYYMGHGQGYDDQLWLI